MLGSLAPDQAQTQPTTPPNGASAASPEDEIRAERRKREYLSLFASNVALSYRKDAFNAPATPKAMERPAVSSQNPDSLQLAQLLKDLQPSALTQQAAAGQSNSTPSSQTLSDPSAPGGNSTPERKEADHPSVLTRLHGSNPNLSKLGIQISRFMGFHRHASSADKVKSLSLNHRLLIAVCSPDGVVETGLRKGPPEKNAP